MTQVETSIKCLQKVKDIDFWGLNVTSQDMSQDMSGTCTTKILDMEQLVPMCSIGNSKHFTTSIGKKNIYTIYEGWPNGADE